MNESSTYDVLAVRIGSREAPISELLLNHHLYGEEDRLARLDYYFWVVRNDSRTVLVDCGFSADAGRRRGLTWSAAPLEALAGLGIRPQDVDQLVVTHAHYDHTGNLAEFPTAEVVMARRELAFWQGRYASRRQFAAFVEQADLDAVARAAEAGRVTLVDGNHSLAPGVELIEVGGHTPGQLVVTVGTPSGLAVLASDAVHLYEEIELDRPYAVSTDVIGVYRAYDVLRELTSSPGSVLVAGHDPEVARRFSSLSGNDAGPVFRIA